MKIGYAQVEMFAEVLRVTNPTDKDPGVHNIEGNYRFALPTNDRVIYFYSAKEEVDTNEETKPKPKPKPEPQGHWEKVTKHYDK